MKPSKFVLLGITALALVFLPRRSSPKSTLTASDTPSDTVNKATQKDNQHSTTQKDDTAN